MPATGPTLSVMLSERASLASMPSRLPTMLPLSVLSDEAAGSPFSRTGAGREPSAALHQPPGAPPPTAARFRRRPQPAWPRSPREIDRSDLPRLRGERRCDARQVTDAEGGERRLEAAPLS